MEATKKSTRKAKVTGKDKILSAYRTAVLRDGREPSSVFTFCESIDMTEDEFYKFFGSFDAISGEIWKGYFTSVESRLKSDSNYAAFSCREKILAFYFTLAEVLRQDRSYALLAIREWKIPALTPRAMKGFKKAFEVWLAPVLQEGKESGEIARRPLLDNRYDSLFWMHLMFILQFWSKDDSAGLENTDAAIEKSVNLAFDLVGKGVLDNALDFGKFLYQTAKN